MWRISESKALSEGGESTNNGPSVNYNSLRTHNKGNREDIKRHPHYCYTRNSLMADVWKMVFKFEVQRIRNGGKERSEYGRCEETSIEGTFWQHFRTFPCLISIYFFSPSFLSPFKVFISCPIVAAVSCYMTHMNKESFFRFLSVLLLSRWLGKSFVQPINSAF